MRAAKAASTRTYTQQPLMKYSMKQKGRDYFERSKLGLEIDFVVFKIEIVVSELVKGVTKLSCLKEGSLVLDALVQVT